MNIFRTPVTTFQLVAVSFGFAAAPDAIADPAQDIYAKYADSVVTITTYDESLFPADQGSGIIINKTDKWHGSFILTNYHVIHRAGFIVVATKSGHVAPAQLRYFDESSDTAVLHTGKPIISAAPTPARTADIGSQVFAIGTPKGFGWTISNGIVSAIRNHNGLEFVQFTAAISNGSSGGPLFDAKGELLGITSFKLRDSENLNFALRISPQIMSELEKHLWLGQYPKPDEPEWCIGHFEQNQVWMNDGEKAKSWNAHSNLIADLERKERSTEKSMTDAEKKAAEQERLVFDFAPTTHRTNRTLTTPINILYQRIRQAYANRFQDFPEDWKGWNGAYDIETDRQIRDRLVSVAAKKWPHRTEVWSRIYSHGVNYDRLDRAMAFVEATAESLPTKQDIDSVKQSVDSLSPGPDALAAVGELSEHENQLKDLISRVQLELRAMSADSPEFKDFFAKVSPRVPAVRRTLTAKGWYP